VNRAEVRDGLRLLFLLFLCREGVPVDIFVLLADISLELLVSQLDVPLGLFVKLPGLFLNLKLLLIVLIVLVVLALIFVSTLKLIGSVLIQSLSAKT